MSPHPQRGASARIINLSKVRRAREKAARPPAPNSLSFVVKRKRQEGGGFNYWAVEPSGNYTADCEAGERIGEEYLAFIGGYPTWGNGTLLTSIVREMIDRAKAGQPWSGIHVGFLSTVNGFAMAMAATRSRGGAA